MPESRLEQLVADRERLVAAMADATPASLPALVREHRAVLAEMADLEPKEEQGDVVDEIAARRSARGGATSRLGQASRGTR